MSTKSKKRGYGGDGNYVETGYAVTVTAVGTIHDENRHLARWKDQLGASWRPSAGRCCASTSSRT